MGEIYRLAAAVTVYLGEEAQYSKYAMIYLASLDGTTWDAPLSILQKWSLGNLLRRPWFSRVWVLQEVFNARSVRVRCGQYEVNWAALQTLRWWHRLGRQDIQDWPLVTTIKDRSTYSSRDLLSLLTLARRCGATDERDKLYALLPMLQDAAKEGLVPDYTLSKEQVFLHFATYISRYGLEFLCAISHPPADLHSSGLPTWVPQWGVDDGIVPLWPDTGRALIESPELTDRGDTYHNPYKINEMKFYESGGSKRNYSVNPSRPDAISPGFPRRLTVRGIRVAQIHTLGPLMKTSIQELLLHRSNSYPPLSKESGFIQCWDEMKSSKLRTADDDYYKDIGDPAGHPLHVSIDAALSHSMWRPDLNEQNASWWGMAAESKMHGIRESDQRYCHWRDEVVGAINGRAVFMSLDGGMGLAPAAASIGDVICIFFGVPVPCVLRKNKDGSGCYHFVGTCYFNGMMTTSAIGKLRERAEAEGMTNQRLEEDFMLL